MINLTPAAEQQIKHLLSKRTSGLGIRLGVKTTGCSGLAYKLEYADKKEQGDNEFAYNGFIIFVDPKSMIYLNEMTVDT